MACMRRPHTRLYSAFTLTFKKKKNKWLLVESLFSLSFIDFLVTFVGVALGPLRGVAATDAKLCCTAGHVIDAERTHVCDDVCRKYVHLLE